MKVKGLKKIVLLLFQPELYSEIKKLAEMDNVKPNNFIYDCVVRCINENADKLEDYDDFKKQKLIDAESAKVSKQDKNDDVEQHKTETEKIVNTELKVGAVPNYIFSEELYTSVYGKPKGKGTWIFGDRGKTFHVLIGSDSNPLNYANAKKLAAVEIDKLKYPTYKTIYLHPDIDDDDDDAE